jgi:pimeloyl-ACP methyl ester carboxylesterase
MMQHLRHPLALVVVLSVGVTVRAEVATPLDAAREIATALPCRSEFFDVEGRPAFVLLPTANANLPFKPWVWYAPTFPGYPEPHHIWMFKQFLEKGIYTVCDMRSYARLARACAAYGMDEATLAAHLSAHNPIDRLKPLADAGVPIQHIHGDSDKVVPLEKNSGELARRYEALCGLMRLIIVPGKGHEEVPEFFQCQELVDFVVGVLPMYP